MKLYRSLAALVTLLVAGLASASSAGRYPSDIATWTLSGIHLGMSPDDALQVGMARHLVGEHPYIGKAPCESERIELVRARKIVAGEAMTSFATGGSCTLLIGPSTFDGGPHPGYRVMLGFTEDLPQHPGLMRLTYIQLFGPNGTDAERIAFLAKVKAKYGVPTRPVYAGSYGFERGLPALQNGFAYESRFTRDNVTIPFESGQGYSGRLKSRPSSEIALVAFSSNGQNTIIFYDGAAMLRSEAALLSTEEAVHPDNAGAPI